MQHKHYDIFKRTVEKLPEINEIVRNESLSPGEKFREHCARIFGRDTVEMIERANRKWAEKHTEYAAQTYPDYKEEDVLSPLTEAEQQAADAEAINVMMGCHKGKPDTSDQTYPL
jgi:hypothetical protein